MENSIIFHPSLSARFEDFGIPIPIIDERAQKVVSHLKRKVQAIPIEQVKPLIKDDLLKVHCDNYIDHFFSQEIERVIYDCYDLQNYSLTKELNYSSFRDHLLFQAGASDLGIKLAIENGFSFFLGGGMHHARYKKGFGFCPIHDFLAAALKNGITPQDIVVIDIDAHQGDGTADIGNKLGVQTISFHMKDGWPLNDHSLEKVHSTFDIGINSSDEEKILQKTQEVLEKVSGKFYIVVAGTDAYEKDELPGTQSLKFNLETMVSWQKLIYEEIKKRNYPQYWLNAGGYGRFSWEPTAHFLNELL
ncbi:MAG: hypothetical protein GY909_17610 [Oligoflexia bacterium]|nr:hypothetical protein [Oligoflexia bacterium]